MNVLSNVVDKIPLVGHLKALGHYAVGDAKGGDKALRDSSRSTAVCAGAALGSLGGPGGVLAGGLAGGALADGVITGVESAINNEYKPYGNVKNVTDIVNNPLDFNAYTKVAMKVASDTSGGTFDVADIASEAFDVIENIDELTEDIDECTEDVMEFAEKKVKAKVKKEMKKALKKRNCPGYHGLKYFETPKHGDQCDKCYDYIEQYEVVYGCRSCAYALCKECYTK